MKTTAKTSDEATEVVSFCCDAPQAQTVYLISDFNAWNQTSDFMQRQSDGSWFLQMPLSRGRHYYLFLVDGEMTLDRHAMFVPLETRHGCVSLVAVS